METEHKTHWYKATWSKFYREFGFIKRCIYFLAKRSSEDRLAQVAGSLTFTTVLALVPLLTVGLSIFTAFPLFASLQLELQNYFAERLMPAQISNQIFEYLNQFSANAKSLTTVGSVALIGTSIITLMTVESEFNSIWRSHKPRPIVQRVLVYWASITLGPILLGLSFSISSYLMSQSVLPLHTDVFASRWLLDSAPLVLSALAFTALYLYLPNCHVRWRDALAGGSVAALAFEGAKRGFGFYIRQFPTYTAVYGAFAAVPIFLLWVYLSWLIILAGAMFTAAFPVLRIGEFQRPRFVGSDMLDALAVLVSLEAAREKDAIGCTTRDLIYIVQRDSESTKRFLAKLKAAGWIAELQLNDARQQWTLVTPAQHITLLALFNLLLMDRPTLIAQLEHSAIPIDHQKLSAALKNNRLDISLAELLNEPSYTCL